MPPDQKSLIGKFLISTILFGIGFMVVHFLIPPEPDTNLFQHYVLPVVVGSALVYFLYFRNNIREADFQGDGKYYLPITYFVGMIFTPIGFVYMAEPIIDNSDFTIAVSIFWGVYLIIIVTFWLMVKNGNQDWKFEDYD